jgi:sterol-4alpha-carboxylate 3-dehydrogenase (decarboxylating)
VKYHQADICKPEAVSSLVAEIQPTVIIHSAALIPSAAKRLSVDAADLRKVNVQGTQNVLNAGKSVGSVLAFIYSSSCDVVKGDSWAEIKNVDETTEMPQRWDEPYAETKVCMMTSHSFS